MHARKQIPREEQTPLQVWVPLLREPEKPVPKKEPPKKGSDPQVDFVLDFTV